MTDIPRTTALAHYNNEFADTNLADYDEEFAAALTANGIEFAVTTLATDTLATNDGEFVATDALDEELVAAATFATYKEKFNAITAITALTDYDEEFATIFALTTYDEEFNDTTPTHYDVKFDALFADYDGEFVATDFLDEKSTNVTLAYYDEQFDAVLAAYDKEIPTTIFADYDEECAAALADHDEEFATIHASNNKEAAATFATHDEEIAAVKGESGGIAK
jgi:hypothetical protein